MTDKIVLELTNVYSKSSRGQEIFKDFNLTLPAGRSALIVGAAGSGKSTLLELLIGRQFASSGSVEVFGELIRPRKNRRIRKLRKRIGGVGGIFTLIPSYTVSENIVFPLIINGERKRVYKERLLAMLTEFSLLKLANEYPNNLTRVENYLVQFARAAVAHQPLILVDEPLAGLDHKTYQRLYDYLTKLALSGLSMIIVTSEDLKADLPNTDRYLLRNGVLE